MRLQTRSKRTPHTAASDTKKASESRGFSHFICTCEPRLETSVQQSKLLSGVSIGITIHVNMVSFFTFFAA